MTKQQATKSKDELKLYGGCALALLAFFALIQSQTWSAFSDPDGFYHARMAHLLAHGRITHQFSWLPFSTWSQRFADQHYLYHALLIPFSHLSVLPVSIILFSTAAMLGFIIILKKFDIRHTWLWTGLALLGSSDFLYRINLVKANTLSLLLLFLAIYSILSKKYIWLLLLAFIFVWTYGGFVFLPIVVVILAWTPLPIVLCLAGITLGLLLHPQFPYLLGYLYNQIFQTGLGARHNIPVGIEWNAYTIQRFLETNGLVFFVWLLALVLYIYQYKKIPAQRGPYAARLFILSALFLVLAWHNQRFVEYWVPFTVLSAAAALNPYLKHISWKNLRETARTHWHVTAGAVILIAVTGAAVAHNLMTVRTYLRDSTNNYTFKGVADWLSANSPPESIVFNSQWDEFPQLFYWNSHNRYIIGMDPTFLYLYDANLYAAWRKISDDDPMAWTTPNQLHAVIATSFHASYIFLEHSRNPNLKAFLDAAPDMFLLEYRDSAVSIYKI